MSEEIKENGEKGIDLVRIINLFFEGQKIIMDSQIHMNRKINILAGCVSVICITIIAIIIKVWFL